MCIGKFDVDFIEMELNNDREGSTKIARHCYWRSYSSE